MILLVERGNILWSTRKSARPDGRQSLRTRAPRDESEARPSPRPSEIQNIYLYGALVRGLEASRVGASEFNQHDSGSRNGLTRASTSLERTTNRNRVRRAQHVRTGKF